MRATTAKPPVVNTKLDLVFRRDAEKYRRRNEYRFAVCLDPKATLSNIKFIALGDLTDIAQYEIT